MTVHNCIFVCSGLLCRTGRPGKSPNPGPLLVTSNGPAMALWIYKEPHTGSCILAIRPGRRRLSFCAEWTYSGRLHIFTTRLKSGSANIWSTRDIRKQGSMHCCRVTFHCPTLLTTILLKTISSMRVSWQSKVRKRGRTSWWRKLQQFEGLLSSFVGW